MKRIISLTIAALVFAFALAACDDKSNVEPKDSSASTATSENGASESNVPGHASNAPMSEDPGIWTPDFSLQPESSASDESVQDESSIGDTSSEPEASGDDPSGDPQPGTTAEGIVALANKLIGKKYKSGGVGPDTFDNSGFVYYVCRQNGVAMPRMISEMLHYGTEIKSESDMQPGDVAIFCNEIDGPAAFVGIYVGGGKFIACNNEDTPTKLQTMDIPYWQARFICGRRVG